MRQKAASLIIVSNEIRRRDINKIRLLVIGKKSKREKSMTIAGKRIELMFSMKKKDIDQIIMLPVGGASDPVLKDRKSVV